MLTIDGVAVGFAGRALQLSEDDYDSDDIRIVNEILGEIAAVAKSDGLAQLWESSIRNFSLTLCLGRPHSVVASPEESASEAAERLLADHGTREAGPAASNKMDLPLLRKGRS